MLSNTFAADDYLSPSMNRTETLIALAGIEGEALNLKARFKLGINDPEAEEWDDCGYMASRCFDLVKQGAIISHAAYDTLTSISEAVQAVCAPHWLAYFPEQLPSLEKIKSILIVSQSKKVIHSEAVGKLLGKEMILNVYSDTCPRCNCENAEHSNYIHLSKPDRELKMILCECGYYFDSGDW